MLVKKDICAGLLHVILTQGRDIREEGTSIEKMTP